MEDKIFFIIIIFVIVLIYYIHNYYNKNNENFDIHQNYDDITEINSDLLSLTPKKRCDLLSQKKFMVRDIRTQLWLISGQEEGFSKFLPGRFGIPLLLSEDPNDYLPLRTIADPNDYLLSSYNGKEIRVVSNPYTKYYILQIFIYNGFNVIGYIDESDTQKYLNIDDDGHIISTINPENASKVELLFL